MKKGLIVVSILAGLATAGVAIYTNSKKYLISKIINNGGLDDTPIIRAKFKLKTVKELKAILRGYNVKYNDLQ